MKASISASASSIKAVSLCSSGKGVCRLFFRRGENMESGSSHLAGISSVRRNSSPRGRGRPKALRSREKSARTEQNCVRRRRHCAFAT